MKRKAQSIVYLLFCIVPILSACSINPTSEKAVLDTLAMESEMTITSSNTRVSDFLAKNKNFEPEYETEMCCNITPDFIADNSDYEIFKYSTSTQSFIMYDGKVYSIGECFGGFGITSMALADLNRDGEYELYYTFSWGSGIHRSQVGYFEPKSKEVHIFDYSLYNDDMMLTVNESGDLCVNKASFEFDDYVNFTGKAQYFMGTVIFEEDRITLNMNCK